MMPLRTLAFTAALVALLTAAVFAFEAKAGPPWGPETPHFNLEVVLRGEGFGLVDDKGTGRAQLFRNLGSTNVGTTFDIKFHVINATTSAVVLESACYQYTVSQ